jgi:hypothetical protein
VATGRCAAGSAEDLYNPAEHGSQCNSTQVIHDDFEDGEISDWWDPDFDERLSAVEEAEGVLIMTPEEGMGTFRSAHVVTRAPYSLRDAAITLDVERVLGGGENSGRTHLTLTGPLDDQVITAKHDGGLMVFSLETPSSFLDNGDLDYDRSKHRYWRIRENAGQISFETSGDRETWSESHLTVDTPDYVDQVKIKVGIYADDEATNLGAARFGDISSDLPMAKTCRSVDFQDDFSASTLDPRWKARRKGSVDCTVSLADEGLTLEGDFTSGGQNCGLETPHAYDLVGNSFTVRLGSGVEDVSRAGIYLTTKWGLNISIHISQDYVFADMEDEEDSNDLGSLEIPGVTHLRLRHAVNGATHSVVAEVSDDGGQSFGHQVLERSMAEAPLKRVYLGLELGTHTPYTSDMELPPHRVTLDDVNLLPEAP